MSTILPQPDPIRRILWQIFDEIQQARGVKRKRLAKRERAIRRAWLADQRRKAGGK